MRAFLEAVEEHSPVQSACLFGSHARGEAGLGSDIDLAVVSEAFSARSFEDNVAISRLTWGIETRIEPIALRPEALQSDTPLMAEIRRNGILVYPTGDNG